MKNSDMKPGTRVTVSGFPDLGIDRSNYQWIDKECEIIKITKAGLVNVKRVDNPKLIRSFSPSSIEPWPIDRSKFPRKLDKEWTIEPSKDIVAYHGLDVEAELCRILQEEIWKEIEAETGETREDLDNKIIAEIIRLHNE